MERKKGRNKERKKGRNKEKESMKGINEIMNDWKKIIKKK